MTYGPGFYLRVMPDYSSDGVWDVDGAMLCLEELPISVALRERIERWNQWYERNEDWKDPHERKTEFDYARHSAEGFAIALLMKAERPEWDVVYHCQVRAQQTYNETRSYDDRLRYEFPVPALL